MPSASYLSSHYQGQSHKNQETDSQGEIVQIFDKFSQQLKENVWKAVKTI